MTVKRPSRVQRASVQNEAGPELRLGLETGPGTQEEAGPRAEPALEFEKRVESEAGPRAEPALEFEKRVESEAGPRAEPALEFGKRVESEAGPRAESALEFEKRVESKAGSRTEPAPEFEKEVESEAGPEEPSRGSEIVVESNNQCSIPRPHTSFKEALRHEDISEQEQKESTGEKVESGRGYKNGEKLGSPQLGKAWESDESRKSSKESGREESDDTVSSESVPATGRKKLGQGDYCLLCTVAKTPAQGKSSQFSGPGTAEKWVQDTDLSSVSLYVDTCWVPRSLFSSGLPSLASTPKQCFWDQHLRTRNRYFQNTRMLWQSLNRNVTFLMGSKKLQQLLKSQEELEKRVQKEQVIKAQVEQEMLRLNGELMKTRAQRRQLLDDHSHLQAEIQTFLDDSPVLMGYVPDPNKKKQVAPIKVWDQQTQQLEQMQWQSQELVSSYESHTSSLREELLQQEVIHAQLKKKIQALDTRRKVQITQEEHIKSLQMTKPRVQKEAEVHLRSAKDNMVKEWRALKHQLSNVELLLGKSIMGKHNDVLEHVADKSIRNFTRQLQNENDQLHKEMVQLIQETREVEAQRARLRKQKQQLQLEQCCLESIKEGRRLKLKAIPCQKGQSSPKTTLAPLPASQHLTDLASLAAYQQFPAVDQKRSKSSCGCLFSFGFNVLSSKDKLLFLVATIYVDSTVVVA